MDGWMDHGEVYYYYLHDYEATAPKDHEEGVWIVMERAFNPPGRQGRRSAPQKHSSLMSFLLPVVTTRAPPPPPLLV